MEDIRSPGTEVKDGCDENVRKSMLLNSLTILKAGDFRKCHPRKVPSQEVLFQGNVFSGKYCSREMLSHRKASCVQRRKGLDGNCIAKV